jgi:hypothetical protein
MIHTNSDKLPPHYGSWFNFYSEIKQKHEGEFTDETVIRYQVYDGGYAYENKTTYVWKAYQIKSRAFEELVEVVPKDGHIPKALMYMLHQHNSNHSKSKEVEEWLRNLIKLTR